MVTLAFHEISDRSARDIWMWLARDKRAAEVAVSPANERGATFSRDSRLLAYISDESGQDQIYVQRYSGRERAIFSNEGGTEPVWSPNGYELFYRNNDRLLAVTIRAEPRLPPARPRNCSRDSSCRRLGGTASRITTCLRTASPLSWCAARTASEMHLRVIPNWHEELKRIVVPAR